MSPYNLCLDAHIDVIRYFICFYDMSADYIGSSVELCLVNRHVRIKLINYCFRFNISEHALCHMLNLFGHANF